MNNELPTYRDTAGLSQGKLAEAVGVSRQMINAIERDRYDLSLELAFELANHFGCRIEELFDPDPNDRT